MEVSLYEYPVYGVAKYLRARGYEIASLIGVRVREPSKDVIGILKPRPPLVRFFFFRVKQRALFIGVLWFTSRGADPEKLWILDVYGRENIKEMTELAEKLSQEFSVSIRVILDKERTDLESYPSDFSL